MAPVRTAFTSPSRIVIASAKSPMQYTHSPNQRITQSLKDCQINTSLEADTLNETKVRSPQSDKVLVDKAVVTGGWTYISQYTNAPLCVATPTSLHITGPTGSKPLCLGVPPVTESQLESVTKQPCVVRPVQHKTLLKDTRFAIDDKASIQDDKAKPVWEFTGDNTSAPLCLGVPTSLRTQTKPVPPLLCLGVPICERAPGYTKFALSTPSAPLCLGVHQPMCATQPAHVATPLCFGVATSVPKIITCKKLQGSVQQTTVVEETKCFNSTEKASIDGDKASTCKSWEYASRITASTPHCLGVTTPLNGWQADSVSTPLCFGVAAVSC